MILEVILKKPFYNRTSSNKEVRSSASTIITPFVVNGDDIILLDASADPMSIRVYNENNLVEIGTSDLREFKSSEVSKLSDYTVYDKVFSKDLDRGIVLGNKGNVIDKVIRVRILLLYLKAKKSGGFKYLLQPLLLAIR